MYELREYQLNAVESLRNQMRIGNKRPLLVSACGSGKTVIAAHIMASAVLKKSRVLFIAHRKEIIDQTSAKLSALDIEHGIIMAGHRPSAMQTVYVASIQTLIRRDPPLADLIIIDEAHHASAATYQKIVETYSNATILGLTATPCRGDGKGLGNTFNSLVQVAQIKELIDMGFLVPAIIYAPSKPDLGGVHIKRGDYDAAELEKASDIPKLVGDIVEHWHKLASDRQTIVFATTIAHSHHLMDAFVNSGVTCEHIDGKTEKSLREQILARHNSGETRILCNVGVCTEGYDSPVVSCIILARPTKSFGLFYQMVGRGMRPYPGKQNMILLDHAGAVYEHGLLDQHIDWTLDSSTQAAKKQKYEKKTLMPWTCGNCFKINEPSKDKHCSGCGLAPLPRAKSPSIGDGLLQKVDKATRKFTSTEDKEKFWVSCIYKASNLGLKIGAAAHMYKKQIGTWPSHTFAIIPKGKTEWQKTASQFLQDR